MYILNQCLLNHFQRLFPVALSCIHCRQIIITLFLLLTAPGRLIKGVISLLPEFFILLPGTKPCLIQQTKSQKIIAFTVIRIGIFLRQPLYGCPEILFRLFKISSPHQKFTISRINSAVHRVTL